MTFVEGVLFGLQALGLASIMFWLAVIYSLLTE